MEGMQNVTVGVRMKPVSEGVCVYVGVREREQGQRGNKETHEQRETEDRDVDELIMVKRSTLQ